ncbi:MAG: AraC family transcriptional regulator [bacterium]|nr:AraC family transcriptional regulator [bacterium]
MDSKKELNSLLFRQRENGIFHKAYEEELQFYKLVQKGDIDAITSYSVLYLPGDLKNYGKLSKDPLRNLTYHFVVLAAMLTRFCIEGGMDYEVAYNLSDLYIQTVDGCSSIKEIQDLHQKMILDYTTRMHLLFRENQYPKAIVLCLDYIGTHLHEKITVKELALYVKKNASYLSKLFKSETGSTISDYITNAKIQASKDRLLFTDQSFSSIASDFAFASQSHFTKVFHKLTGLTPLQYRNIYFRKQISPKPAKL